MRLDRSDESSPEVKEDPAGVHKALSRGEVIEITMEFILTIHATDYKVRNRSRDRFDVVSLAQYLPKSIVFGVPSEVEYNWVKSGVRVYAINFQISQGALRRLQSGRRGLS